MPSATALLDRAADHLTRAADLAETTDPAFAGQIRLASATLPGVADDSDLVHVPDTEHSPASFPSTAGIEDQLRQALDCLDQVAPLDGPPDMQLCAWHLHELCRIAAHGIAS